MAVPSGAQRVKYAIAISEWTPEVDVTFVCDNAVDPIVRQCLEIGANAMLAHLRTQYPGAPLSATRVYEGITIGDTDWPPPPPAPES